VNSDIRDTVHKADAFVLDFFQNFLDPWKRSSAPSRPTPSGARTVRTTRRATRTASRPSISALAHDDGASSRDLDKADVILVGVSRSGKTPTSLYLSLQFGIRAANCPLIPEDFDRLSLPKALDGYRKKLFGLSNRSGTPARDPQRAPPQQQICRTGERRWEVQQRKS